MGRMRPVSPTQTEPDKPEPKPKRKRKPGGGRKTSLTPEEIERGIRILRSHDRMTVEAARRTLRRRASMPRTPSLYDACH